jgi:hypothetical protein
MAGKDRQRRYRERLKKHAAGDHSQCLPERCDHASVDLDETAALNGAGVEGGDVTGDVTSTSRIQPSHRDPPAGLLARGSQLWEEMAGLKLGPAHVLLLERTCRMADRCARLDELLEGGDWVELVEVPGTDGAVVRVVVDRALSELRQHEIALKLTIAELRHAGRPATAAVTSPPAAEREPEGGAAGGNVRSLAAIRNRSTGG